MEVPDAVRQMVDASIDPAVVLDDDRRVLYYNRGYENLAGMGGRELARKVERGIKCHDLFKLEICESSCLGCAARDAARSLRADEIAAVGRDDTRFTVSAVPIAVDGGRITVESYRDTGADHRIQRRMRALVLRERRARTDLEDAIRDRSRALEAVQSQLIHQDKMSTLGRLVAGIAHELNNPINFIYGNVDFLGHYLGGLIELAELVDGEPLPDDVRARFDAMKKDIDYDHLRGDWHKLVRSIRAGAERSAGIVRDLRTFSRASGADLREVDLVAQLDTTLTLINPLIKDRIQIRRAVATDVPIVIGNPGHIGQVFMNLLTNAAQAIAGDGWIEVAIATTADRGVVRIVVADSGPGIDPGAMARVVDPFYTTKEVGEGTGLGLWITDSVVRAHGGHLTWANRRGAGAEFTVTLPVSPPAPAPDHSGEWRGG